MWVVLLLIQKQFSLCYSCRVVFLLYLSIWNQNDRCEPHNFLKWHIVFGSWWQKHQQHCCKIQLQHFTNKRIFLAKITWCWVSLSNPYWDLCSFACQFMQHSIWEKVIRCWLPKSSFDSSFLFFAQIPILHALILPTHRTDLCVAIAFENMS